MRIDVHIERLVLEGLPVTSVDGPRVRAAMEGEIGRLLGATGLSRSFATGGAVPHIKAPNISLSSRERPDAIGRAVARSVQRGIGENE
jgi:hypothetical protein